MVHVSCDLCGRSIRVPEDQRFVVKIEVYAAHNPYEITEEDLQADSLEAVSELLEDEDLALADVTDEPLRQSRQFDLCGSCRKSFLKDPLSRESHLNFEFSEN